MAILKNASFHSKDSLAFHVHEKFIVFAVCCQVTLKFTTGEL